MNAAFLQQYWALLAASVLILGITMFVVFRLLQDSRRGRLAKALEHLREREKALAAGSPKPGHTLKNCIAGVIQYRRVNYWRPRMRSKRLAIPNASWVSRCWLCATRHARLFSRIIRPRPRMPCGASI
jgi:hypothetical protein